MLTRVLLGWKGEEAPTFDVKLDPQTESEPSPLLEAIRLYLERAH